MKKNKTIKYMLSIPLISVILPVYNGEKYIAESVDSILKQTFADFEFIIVNDGSVDNTKEVILAEKDIRAPLKTECG